MFLMFLNKDSHPEAVLFQRPSTGTAKFLREKEKTHKESRLTGSGGGEGLI